MSKPGKAAKPPKDPNAPVKPPTAFFIFLREEQGAVRREMERDGSAVSNDIVASECGRRWHSLDPAVKQRYYEEWQVLKTKYEQEMMSYKQSPDVMAAANIANIAKLGKNKDPARDLPQMFKDYFAFLVSNWQAVALGMPNDSPAEIQQTIWNIWSGSRVVTREETTTMPMDTNFNLTQQSDLSFSHNHPREIDQGNGPITLRPKVPPPKLAFHFFVDAIKEQKSYQKNPLSESQIIRLCQERWDGMSEEEMKCFNVMELQDMGRYERELAQANRLLQQQQQETPESASKSKKRPMRKAAVKAVNHVSGTDDDEDTPVKIKRERHDPSYNNDDSKAKVKMEKFDTPYKSVSHQGDRVLGEDLDLDNDEASDNFKGKLEINENYESDEY